MGEITVILLLALIVLGPKKLPELASGLGKIIRDLRKATSDVKNEIQLDDTIRKPFEELRDAVTLPPEELKRRDRLKKDLEEAKRKAEEEMKILAAKADADPPPSPEAVPPERASGRHALFGSGPVSGSGPHVPPPIPAPGIVPAPGVVPAPGAPPAVHQPPPGTIPAAAN